VNSFSKYLVMMSMTAAIGVSALAAETGERADGGGKDMGWHHMTPEQMRAGMQKHQAMMHDQLKLSSAQEPAWKSFVAATTPAEMGKHWGDRAAMEKMSAPERLEKHLAMSKERDARMQSHLAALKTFYAVLTPEQQKTFDHSSMHGRKHHGHHDGERMQKG
jgi:protein CpxP